MSKTIEELKALTKKSMEETSAQQATHYEVNQVSSNTAIAPPINPTYNPGYIPPQPIVWPSPHTHTAAPLWSPQAEPIPDEALLDLIELLDVPESSGFGIDLTAPDGRVFSLSDILLAMTQYMVRMSVLLSHRNFRGSDEDACN